MAFGILEDKHLEVVPGTGKSSLSSSWQKPWVYLTLRSLHE